MKKSNLSKLADELIRLEAYESPEKAKAAFDSIYTLKNSDVRTLFAILLQKRRAYHKPFLALLKKIDPASLKQTVNDSIDYSDRSTNDLRRMEKQLLLARDMHSEFRAIVQICERLVSDGSRVPKGLLHPHEDLGKRITSAKSVKEELELILSALSGMEALGSEFIDRRLTHVQQLLDQDRHKNTKPG